jgi:hypothetical protein
MRMYDLMSSTRSWWYHSAPTQQSHEPLIDVQGHYFLAAVAKAHDAVEACALLWVVS